MAKKKRSTYVVAKAAKKKLAAHSVHQRHMVLEMRLVGEVIALRVVEPGVSNARPGEMAVPREFGEKLCPGMVLKTTLSIEGIYRRKKGTPPPAGATIRR